MMRLPMRSHLGLLFTFAALFATSGPSATAGPEARARILLGDVYGAGEFREAARGLSMVLRASLHAVRPGTLVESAAIGPLTGGARVVHQAVAAEWAKKAGAGLAIGG